MFLAIIAAYFIFSCLIFIGLIPIMFLEWYLYKNHTGILIGLYCSFMWPVIVAAVIRFLIVDYLRKRKDIKGYRNL